ncbi:Uncharacterised protein [Klebsiella quasivariicola]|uniref:sialate O-acetylesterase n=1 Tax=Klebsiella quasivariicola TaxID=2026240 RepID=UPI000E2DCDF5|nr:sialate O-acetylesterase [Klebsiella quasivariicola]SXD43910.1 Uncharacterised protein [Klebsiella quasivariicola]
MADNEKLGSTSPEVLLKNVVILDKLVSDKEKESLPDRFGALRRTWHGMEMVFSRFIEYVTGRGEQAISAIGWQELGSWATGITIDNRQQIVYYNGSWYKYLGELEHVITGDSPENDGGVWSAENSTGKWSNIGDAALRSNLVSSGGANLVGWKETTVDAVLNQAYRYYADVFDVFILYGQSNIVGYADNTPGYPSSVDNYVTYYNPATGQIAKVVPAMKHASGNTSSGHAWAAFGNEYRRQTGRKILFVPCGKGETAIADFVPGSDLYNLMLTTVAAAKTRMNASGRVPGKTCILFHQGEQDMTQGTTRQDYQDRLVSLVTGTSTDLSIDKFFFLRVGCPQSRTEESWSGIQAVQDFVCQSFNICNMAFADFGKFTKGNGLLRPDGTHATQNGYNYMGQEAAKNVADSLMAMSSSSPAEMQLYGVPVLPQDQIWRYTYARAIKTDAGWVMPDANNSNYMYRTANILKMEVNDTFIRFYIQSRADWILDLEVDVNYLASQYAVRAAVSFATVSTNVYALDVSFFCNLSFGCSKTGQLTSAPGITPANTLITGNLSSSVDSTHDSIIVKHNGSQSFPDVCSYGGGVYENTIGDVGIASMSSKSFAIVNNGTGGVLCTLRDAIVKPATLLSGMQVNVKALVCEYKA